MEITYTRVGDYYLPNLAAPESPKVGRWGMLHFNYLSVCFESFLPHQARSTIRPDRASC